MRSRAEATELINRAAETNRTRDEDERRVGFGAPPDGPMDLYLRTAESAIECGILCEDWNAVAEGFVMVRDICQQMVASVPPGGGVALVEFAGRSRPKAKAEAGACQ